MISPDIDSLPLDLQKLSMSDKKEEFMTADEVIPKTAPEGSAYTNRNSLYIKFDPLMANATPPTAGPVQRTITEAISELPNGKLLDLNTPEAVKAVSRTEILANIEETPKSKPLQLSDSPPRTEGRGGLRYTEADLKRRVDQAVKQSQEEASILQMEIEDLRTSLNAERAEHAQMRSVVEEYENAMSKMIEKSESNDVSGKLLKLEQEKQQVETDLAKTESAFADLLRKYEKSKEVVGALKKNEATLKNACEQAQLALKQSEERYAALKEHAEQKINTANEEIAKVRDDYKAQIALLTVKIKKAESEAQRAERQLEAKEKDNEELTSICNDLVKQLEARNS